MKTVVILASCLLAVASAAPMMETRGVNEECGKSKVAMSRIVGGSEAQKGQYPWIASLRFKRTGSSVSSHSCGCSIIDDEWILVAAHCFINSDNPANYIVRVGTHNQSAGANEKDAVEHTVAKIIKHKSFSMSIKIQNDIALLKLSKKVNFNSEHVSRVCLPEKHPYNTDGDTLTVAGWGDTIDGNGKGIPDNLKNTDLIAQTDAYCKKQWGSFMWSDNQMLCAMAPATSPCVGDSGGPLMTIDDKTGARVQVGVVSFGESSCAGPRPPVFTRVSNYVDWIHQQMKDN